MAGDIGLSSLTTLGGGRLGWIEGDPAGGAIVTTDGTLACTQRTAGYGGGVDLGMAALGNGKVVFGAARTAAQGDQLELLDTATGIASQLKVINAGGAHILNLTSFGIGHALFTATDGTHGQELWITDGTAAGTALVADLFTAPPAAGSYPQDITDLGNGKAVFQASTGNPEASTLFVTDGSAGGTHALLANLSFVYTPIVALGNGLAVFGNADNWVSQNRELWVTDGTAAGTHKLMDIATPSGANPHDIVALGDGQAVFSANDGVHGDEVWITDGTAAGTHLLSDIWPGAPGSAPTTYAAIHYTPPAPIVATGYGQTLTGTAGADTITDTFGGAIINAGAGNDSINAGGYGNHVLGGAGNDIVTYSGAAAQYGIVRNADGSLTVSGPGGQDQLSHVELIQFADGQFNPTKPVHGDLNNDYHADLMVQNSAGDIWARLSTGAWADVGTDTGYVAKFTGDFVGDGAGWIVSQRASDGAVLLQHSLGGAPVASSSLAGWGASEVVVGVGDFSGDGHDELLLRDSGAGNLAIEVLNGVAETPLVQLNAPGTAWNVVGTGDFYGDGHTDILFKGAGTYWVWEMNGNAIVGGGAVSDPGGTWQVKAIADLNGDGRDDLVWQDATGALYLWEMNGLTPTALPLGNVGTWWNLVGAADITGDGKADLEFQAQDGTLYYWAMNGNQITGGGWLGQLSSDWHVVH